MSKCCEQLTVSNATQQCYAMCYWLLYLLLWRQNKTGTFIYQALPLSLNVTIFAD